MKVNMNIQTPYAQNLLNPQSKAATEIDKKHVLDTNIISVPKEFSDINSTAKNGKARFDTFVNMINEDSKNQIENMNAELEIKKTAIDRADSSWDLDTAARQFKNVCEEAIKFEENAKNEFFSLKEEKEYYEKLKKDGKSYLSENGKYMLSDTKKNEMINKDDLDKAMEDVQSRIDGLINKTSKFYEKTSRAYELAGTALMAYAGEAAYRFKGELQPLKAQLPPMEGYSALGEYDNIYAFDFVNRTEDNFMTFSDGTVEDVKGKLDILDKIMEDVKIGDLEPKVANTHELHALLAKIAEIESEEERNYI